MVRKYVVGWQAMNKMLREGVITLLQRTFWAWLPTRPARALQRVRQLLHDRQALRAQSRRNDCYDGAQVESLWSHLKTKVRELHKRLVLIDLADGQTSIADYFDYYNHWQQSSY